MLYRSSFGLALTLLALSGCASMFTAVADRPVSSDKYVYAKDSNKTQKISGDRRFARIVQLIPWETDGQGKVIYDKNDVPMDRYPWIICIEPHADAISAKSASSAIAVADKGSMSDSVATQLLQTFQRTQAADIVRRLPFVACEAYLNSPMTQGDQENYQRRVDEIIEGSLKFLNTTPQPSTTEAGKTVVSEAKLPTTPTVPVSDKATKEAEAKKKKLDQEIADREATKAALDKEIKAKTDKLTTTEP